MEDHLWVDAQLEKNMKRHISFSTTWHVKAWEWTQNLALLLLHVFLLKQILVNYFQKESTRINIFKQNVSEHKQKLTKTSFQQKKSRSVPLDALFDTFCFLCRCTILQRIWKALHFEKTNSWTLKNQQLDPALCSLSAARTRVEDPWIYKVDGVSTLWTHSTFVTWHSCWQGTSRDGGFKKSRQIAETNSPHKNLATSEEYIYV